MGGGMTMMMMMTIMICRREEDLQEEDHHHQMDQEMMMLEMRIGEIEFRGDAEVHRDHPMIQEDRTVIFQTSEINTEEMIMTNEITLMAQP